MISVISVNRRTGALGDTRKNQSPVRFYSIYNNSLLSEAKKRIYPFQCLATDSIAKQFAFKFMQIEGIPIPDILRIRIVTGDTFK